MAVDPDRLAPLADKPLALDDEVLKLFLFSLLEEEMDETRRNHGGTLSLSGTLAGRPSDPEI